MKCLVCKNEKAAKHPTYGILPCDNCRQRVRNTGIQRPVEFTTEEIKSQRKEYKKDTLQPWVGGNLNKEYIDEYGFGNVVAEEYDIKHMKYADQDEYYNKN